MRRKPTVRVPATAAIAAIGSKPIIEHFAITRQTLWEWKVRGIPLIYHRALLLLGESLGHDMSQPLPEPMPRWGSWNRKSGASARTRRQAAGNPPGEKHGTQG